MNNTPPLNLDLTPIHPELDWQAGDTSKIIYNDRTSNWGIFFAAHELQNRNGTESSWCVTFSALKAIAAQIRFLYLSGFLSDKTISYLRDNGYMDDKDDVNFSESFTAIDSGTTPQGNSGNAVGESIRKSGLLPDKKLPWIDGSWNELNNPKRITHDMRDLAKRFWTDSGLLYAYDWVYLKGQGSHVEAIRKYVKQTPIQIFAPVCPGWSTDNPVRACNWDIPQHATNIYGIDDFYRDLDSYMPFLKTLQLSYPVLYGMRHYCSTEARAPQLIKTKDGTTITKNSSWTDAAWEKFKALLTKYGVKFTQK